MPGKRTYLFFRFDVTDLTEAERDGLGLEVEVQAEASDNHPTVKVESWVESEAV